MLPAGIDHSYAVQSAFLTAYRNIKLFRADSSFKTWITRIVLNHSLMYVRSSRRVRLVSLDVSRTESRPLMIPDTRPTPEDAAQKAEFYTTLKEAAATLQGPLRE